MSAKDKINILSGISLICIIGISILIYAIDKNSTIFPLNLMYVSIPLFLIWFGTRKNGCGSCNQVYKDQSKITQ
ncbi:MAG: hypothetical protein COY74_03835 [Nitrosopumilales archaeon CG_4_10_14_0_8_um_filter_34_8]|nr:MAG: hypothetical protein COY74_03835 [Nitrosopumilales archaeon CG_4_10_14_0_8_um_filter_34_8]PJB96647.1 MAG: hypothetical protein CO079_09355 [Nitrosopumilales archaeon CG_4_9_14_0_8_um_filter_34_10]